jgi:RNA polymerase sigma factor (sigma-70 family)
MTIALQGTPSTTCTEHELVAAVRRGDDRAFEVLFSRYERRITAYVAGMVGDHARAEDITQDVFISALRRMRATERPIAFKPWIYEIAKNACIDEFRRARRAQEVSFEEDEGSTFAAHTVYIHAPGPQAAIESKQRLDDLCGAFGGLSESHHRVLVLRELEGLSYTEIGERLGMTRAMVESTLFRARRRLSEEYEELTSGRRCARVQSLIDSGSADPLASLGIRDRRQLTRHLAHCRPCRRLARIGGVDESLLEPRRRIAKIAALLPLPLLRWRRGASSDEKVAQSGSHSLAVAQSLQNVAQLVDPSGPAAAFGRAAAAAAAIAIAGAGGGLVVSLGSGPSASASTGVAAASAPARHVLSLTKILTLAKTSGSASQSSPVLPWSAPVAAGVSPAQAEAQGAGGQESGGTISIAGSGAGHSGGGDGSAPNAGASSGGATPPGGSGGSHGGSQPAVPGGGGVPLPSGAGGSGTPSGSGTPPVSPSPPSGTPSGTPNVSTPQPVNAPSAGASVPVPDPTSVPSQAQSVVQDPSSTATQTVSSVQQSVPSPPTNIAVSPPPGA